MKLLALVLASSLFTGSLFAQEETHQSHSILSNNLNTEITVARNICEKEAILFGGVSAQVAYADNCLRHALVADLAHLEKAGGL